MTKFLALFQNSVWNLSLLLLLLGTHLYFTVGLRFIQKKLPLGIRMSFSKGDAGTGSVSPYAALATALAATIGTGNIIGVSTAIALGGPGAVFWCWITGILGMATSYAECFLTVRYRVKKEDGSFEGGPMYVLERVLHRKKTALFFAIFTLAASFGVGSSVQSHAIGAAVTEKLPISLHVIGIVTALLAGSILLEGNQKIATVCTLLVPVMCFFYLGGCALLLYRNRAFLLKAVAVIVEAAFTSQSVLGGVAGAAVIRGMGIGISKGLLTNEAGMGSAALSAADAGTDCAVCQGLVSMTGVFWDTVVMCALTGLTIVSTMLKNPEVFWNLAPDKLCFAAFSLLPKGEWMLTLSLVLFAFATIIGWSYYGEKAARYLFGDKGLRRYQLCFLLAIYLGTVLSLDMVWNLAELFNTLMAIPNIYSLLLLRRVIIGETNTVQSR